MSSIVMLFPGQGSQYVGMGKDFYENFPSVRGLFERASDLLKMDLKRLCFDGPEDVLKQTVNVQPAVTLVNAACLEPLLAAGVRPTAAAGHSLGEYTALYAAGVFGFDDLMELVRFRGEFMQEAADRHPGGMLAVMGLGLGEIETVCKEASGDGSVEIANHNSPSQVILTGDKEALRTAARLAKEKKAKLTIPLNVSGPWHSVHMKEARVRMAEVLKDRELKPAEIKVVANATSDYQKEPDAIRDNLIRQITSPVLWSASIERLISDGFTSFVEVGPKKTLKGLLKDIDRGVKAHSVEDSPTLDSFLTSADVQG